MVSVVDSHVELILLILARSVFIIRATNNARCPALYLYARASGARELRHITLACL